MKRGEFYEDDEPVEKIRAILARPASGLTGRPVTAGATVTIGDSAVLRPAVAVAGETRHTAVACP